MDTKPTVTNCTYDGMAYGAFSTLKGRAVDTQFNNGDPIWFEASMPFGEPYMAIYKTKADRDDGYEDPSFGLIKIVRGYEVIGKTIAEERELNKDISVMLDLMEQAYHMVIRKNPRLHQPVMEYATLLKERYHYK